MHIGEHGIPPWEFQPKPGPGQYTFKSLCRYLNLPTAKAKALLAQAGIELGPYIREGKYVRKVYKHFYRYLTRDEVKRAITLYRMQQGEKELQRIEKRTARGG